MTLHDADVVTSVRTVAAVDNDSGQIVHPVRITSIVRLQWSITNTDVILSKIRSWNLVPILQRNLTIMAKLDKRDLNKSIHSFHQAMHSQYFPTSSSQLFVDMTYDK